MKILFWLTVVADGAALVLFFLLGLAAAPSSRTSPITVAGPKRDLADAIARNDTATMRALVPTVDVNARGLQGMAFLMLALRRLQDAPTAVEPIRFLLKAGAKPDLVTMYERPLNVAIQQSNAAGVEPVVLTALLDHGARLNARDREGRTAVFDGVTTLNYRSVLILLERGVEYKGMRSINGEAFQDMVESNARRYGDSTGAKEVLEFLKHHR